MPAINGFKEGCPGVLEVGQTNEDGSGFYYAMRLQLEAEGQSIKPGLSDTEPDSVRAVYGATTYQDVYFAFSAEAADAQVDRHDNTIPEGNVYTLSEIGLADLNRVCGSCATRGDERCLILDRLLFMKFPTIHQGTGTHEELTRA
jgi:hypothetical protein